MDNFTHTLIGVLVGETFARTTRASSSGLEPQRRRNLLVTTSAIASNLPDLDFIPSAITGDKLQYLMQHRGHTHTLLGLLVICALVSAGFDLWCRWRKWQPAATDRVQLGAVTLLALLLHVAMDFTNNYGVHPFWPFNNGWLYGDTIFIWEPLLWVAAAPLIFLLRTKL
ncbi:MAG: metal-dependent hydrolase, partial [Povalibacter sp.]